MHTYKRKKRINGYLIVELNAQDRELIVIRVSVVLVDETLYEVYFSKREVDPRYHFSFKITLV